MARRNNRGSGMIPLMLFQAVNEYRRLERKPPVTAALVAANTLIYLRPKFLLHILPSIDHVWFNAHLIIKNKDLKRFFLSAFYHLDESHLVYNMMSLLWKGIQLENSMGSREFASMVAALLGLSQGITLLLAKSLVYFDYKRAYFHEYSVGFSGVLFAMKVVLNNSMQSESRYSNIHGFAVPTQHAAWAELILIQLLVPGVSFLGHLGGILAGIVYLQLKAARSPISQLTTMVKGVTSLLGWPFRFFGQPRVLGNDERRRSADDGIWRCPVCTFDNSGWLRVCEVCETSRDGGSSHLHSEDISLDEIRQRRIRRFGR